MKNDLISKTYEHVKAKFENEGTGHEWWHIYRVWVMAKRICEAEIADETVVQLGALLHDIADYKENNMDTKVGGVVSRAWLESLGVDEKLIEQVVYIVDRVSYKGEADNMETLEGQIVQDADRLDAIGAIGVARVFTWGGAKGRAMHDPAEKAQNIMNFEDYKKAGNTSINHFYEKLLLVKGRMHTETAKQLAEGRHKFLENYLAEFFAEWEGEK